MTDVLDPIGRGTEDRARFFTRELESREKMGRAEISARMKMAGMSASATRAGIKSQAKIEKEKIKLARQELERVGIPQAESQIWARQKQVELAEASLELDRFQFNEQHRLGRDRFDFERQQWVDQNRQFDQKLGFERERFEKEYGLEERKLAQQESQFGRELGFREKELTQQEAQFARQLAQEESQFGRELSARESELVRRLAHEESQLGRQLTQQEAEFARRLAQEESQFGRELTFRETELVRRLAQEESQFGRELGFREKELGQRTGLEEQRIGLEAVGMASKMGGPGDWADYLDFSAGVNAPGSQVPVFVQRLMGGQAASAFGATRSDAPPARTLGQVGGDIAGGKRGYIPPGQVGGGGAGEIRHHSNPDAQKAAAAVVKAMPPSGTPGWNARDVAVLDAIDALYKSPHQMAPGSYEGMSDDQRAFLAGGARKRGHSQNTFNTLYRNSRIYQGSPSGTA